MHDWFAHCQTIEEARAEYRRLCFEHHPDYGGRTDVMQAINTAYARFKHEWSMLQRVRASARSQYRQPAYRQPRSSPSASSPKSPDKEPHPRSYLYRIWNRASWQPDRNGSFRRTVWGHAVTLFQHPSPKYQGAWFVLVDGDLSPYSYDNRAEAEQDAFNLVYEKVKYRDL
jgi:hypothetical protein